FDELVENCRQLNDYTRGPAAELRVPHDYQEIARDINVQREQGENAYRNADQRAYADAIQMLDGIQRHLVGILHQVDSQTDTRTEGEGAAGAVEETERRAKQVQRLAEAEGRRDLSDEVATIQRRLTELAQEAHRDPRRVQQKVRQHYLRLDQMRVQLASHA